ncbi:phosphatidylinositol-glycan biosynthesis class X protein-like [Oscarella lobularis]|uniref:phosphatidylinositol-glycan biosynthesis class X protein-like n=1 Tax=Oscarella lobularis TaxID=121494 RepID=UPI003313F6E4
MLKLFTSQSYSSRKRTTCVSKDAYGSSDEDPIDLTKSRMSSTTILIALFLRILQPSAGWKPHRNVDHSSVQQIVELFEKEKSLECFDDRVKITRWAENSGFHRNVVNSVKFESFENDCSLLLVEYLPGGMYVDSDELRKSKSFGDYALLPANESDVEAMAETSPSNLLFAFANSSFGSLVVRFPIHLRYHRATNGGTPAQISLSPPLLFSSCPMNLPCHNVSLTFRCSAASATNSNCLWHLIPYQIKSKSNLLFLMPTGNLNIRTSVIVVTAAVVLGAWLVLGWAVNKHALS